jgi:hypothetical protein
MSGRSRRITLLLACSAVAALVVLVVPWVYYGFGSAPAIEGALAPEEGCAIRSIVAAERWRLAGSAAAKGNIKFMAQIALARVDLVAGHSGPGGIACVVCSDRFGSGRRWSFDINRSGVDAWKIAGFHDCFWYTTRVAK